MRRIFTLVLITVCSLQSISQKSIIRYEEIDYLKDPTKVSLLKEPFDSRIGIKIININKKLVNVTNDVQSVALHQEVPKIFEIISEVSVPAKAEEINGLASGFELLSETQINNLEIPEEQKMSLKEINNKYQKLAGQIETIRNALGSYNSIITQLKAVVTYNENLLYVQDLCDKTFEEIESAVNDLTKATFLADPFHVPKPDRLLLETESNITTNRSIIIRYLNSMLNEADKYNETLNNFFTPINKEKFLKEIELLKTVAITFASKVKTKKASGDNSIGKMDETFMSNISSLKSDLESLYVFYEKANLPKLQEVINEFRATGKAALLKTYDHFNVVNYTYYLKPQPIDKDATTISIDIIPKEDIRCSPAAKSYSYTIRPKGRIKIDFSSGFFANFGGSDFRDQSYRLDTIAGDTENYIIKKNKNKNSIFPSVGALMHVYKRTGNEFNFSGTFGISTKDLDKINYHLGGSLIFGYSQRFILSSGLTLTKASLINDKYDVNQVIPRVGAPESVPTATFNRIGYFLALTYNLTSK